MKLYFLVEVEVVRKEYDQAKSEFEKEDAPAMFEYLKEKTESSLQDSWQYNAVVSKVKVKTLN